MERRIIISIRIIGLVLCLLASINYKYLSDSSRLYFITIYLGISFIAVSSLVSAIMKLRPVCKKRLSQRNTIIVILGFCVSFFLLMFFFELLRPGTNLIYIIGLSAATIPTIYTICKYDRRNKDYN